ncbi:PEP-CTERM sorting domain-containing protein [Massilia soli]|uniref:PEP-CTERM sorting domain-containing protein n=1 Tax=Massilia soli TaxID=2792854 RepID=A0ABS7SRZ7_9BURK|nr:PEP-CTERM sorting domain-containing protein [Massilia soli]MBZ2208717.1 PEP-CTERM sorting domain-containing protein [Massilia soli]
MSNLKKTKNLTMSVIAGTALLIGSTFSTAALAEPMYMADTMIGSGNLGNSGDETEMQFLRDLVGDQSLMLDKKVATPTPALIALDDDGQWYINVDPDEPGYFMLKFGVGNLGLDTHYFFRNIGELTKLVWTNADVNFLTGGDCGANNQSACNIGRLSHYLITDPDTDVPPNEVPEPGSLALAGLGLLGLWAGRRSAKR